MDGKKNFIPSERVFRKIDAALAMALSSLRIRNQLAKGLDHTKVKAMQWVGHLVKKKNRSKGIRLFRKALSIEIRKNYLLHVNERQTKNLYLVYKKKSFIFQT